MTAAQLKASVLTRLGDDPAIPTGHYSPAEVLAALNTIQRMFVLMTLCLETTATFQLTATTYYKMLTVFSDWILPLRIRMPNGVRLKPSRLADLTALAQNWNTVPGTPERYALEGFDLLAVYKLPSATLDTNIVSITYARGPAPMTLDADVPELQPEYHQSLIDGAIPLLRVKEGAQEWQKTLPLWTRYMNSVQKLGEYMRARNRELGYDYLPAELARFDQSKVLTEEVVNG